MNATTTSSTATPSFALLLLAAAMATAMPQRALAADEEMYSWDAGASLGISGYLGDLNSGNPFRHPGLDFSATAAYLFNDRWSLRGRLGVDGLSGTSRDLKGTLPGVGENDELKFSSKVWQLTVSGEFNFLPYGIGETYRHLSRISPYLTVGAGVAMSDGGHAALAIPMGAGVRYKISRRLNLNLQFTMTKMLGDKMDSSTLTDLYGVKSSMLKNTDWTSTIAVGITYEFGWRCSTCHYVD